jgi:hypothetical protein
LYSINPFLKFLIKRDEMHKKLKLTPSLQLR